MPPEKLPAQEQALRASEARYRSLVTSAAQAVWTTDAAGVAVEDLSAWHSFTGQMPDRSSPGPGWLEAFHETDQPLIREAWSRANATVASFRVECRLRRHDGEYRHVALRAVPVVDEGGAIREWVWAFIDITKRVETERRRSLTNELLDLFARKDTPREYLESVVALLAQWLDCHGVSIRIAEEGHLTGHAWFGYDPGFVELESRLSLTHDSCCCTRAVTGAHRPEDLPLITPQGSYLCTDLADHCLRLSAEERQALRGNCVRFGYRSVIVIPIRCRDQVLGAIHLADPRQDHFSGGTVALLEDVAPLLGEAIRRFRAESQLTLYRDNLERLVKQRTAELETANARLQAEIEQRQKTELELRKTAAELERSNHDLEQFAYVASHDLQEPLRAISGYLRLLEHRFPDRIEERAREYMAGVVEAAERMRTLIRDLLAFARVGGQAGRSAASCDLGEALADALRNLQTAIHTSGARITSEKLPRVPLDHGLAVQLLQNLIGNGLKFRRVDPPEIHVLCRAEGPRWVIGVRDNGIGIAPQYHARLFQIFQRLHTRKEYPGTGIGLALCKRILERNGGAIWLESQAGQGATFYFALPVVSVVNESE